MRSILLPLAMLAACGAAPDLSASSVTAPAASAPAVSAPAAQAPAASSMAHHHEFFLQHVDPADILAWDPRASMHGAAMRQQLAIAPITGITIPPPITIIGTTGVATSSPTTVAPVDADSDGYDAGQDCNDNNSSIYPGAAEVVNNGVDEDCDGVESCYQDADGDTYGGTVLVDSADLTCTAAGLVGNSLDCLDVGTVAGTSGDIAASAINPDAAEACDGVDNDCDTFADDDDPNFTGGVDWHEDADGDGFGSSAVVATQCLPITDTVADGTDCADDDANVNPSATEDLTNGVDDNCDGLIDAVDTDEPGDTDDIGDTSDRGDGGGKDAAKCGCDTSSGPTPGVLALAMSMLGTVLTRRRKV